MAKRDAPIKAEVAQDAAPQSQRRRLMSIPGVASLIGAVLRMRMCRVDYVISEALVAAIGLEHCPCQSDQYAGARRP